MIDDHEIETRKILKRYIESEQIIDVLAEDLNIVWAAAYRYGVNDGEHKAKEDKT